MRRAWRMTFVCVCALALTAGVASANTVQSSTIWFEGILTAGAGGAYSGILMCVDEAAAGIGDGISGFDIYGMNGANAWFGDDPGGGPLWSSVTMANHDAWPAWNPDTPDWYQYSLLFYVDEGGQQKWLLQNHPGATAAHPWYDSAWWGPGGLVAMGIPMSGLMDWSAMYAEELDAGAYLPGTGTAEIPGGAAGYGGGAHAWDMDWSWGSEVVPLEYPGFSVSLVSLGGMDYRVSLTPVPEPMTLALLGIGIPALAFIKRRRNR